MNKKCSCCEKIKQMNDFNFRNKDKNIKQSYCRECGKLKTRKHYKENIDYYVKKAYRNTLKIKNLIHEIKSVPCMDCGIKYPYYVMDFDHVVDKHFTIGEKWWAKGINVVKDEIEKCEVVCSNCHRIRTYNRKNAPIA